MEYTKCTLSILDDSNVSYEDEYTQKKEEKVPDDPLRHNSIERFNRWVADYEVCCEREDFKVLGRHLYELLFTGTVRQSFEGTYKKFMDRAKKSGENFKERLQLRLEFHEGARKLSAYPWEFMFMPTQEGGVFLAGQITQLILTRFVSEISEELKPSTEPLRILAVHSHPRKLPKLVGAEEIIRDIESLMTSHSNQIKVKVLDNPTYELVRTTSDDFKPHVFHFIGHGLPGKVAFSKEKDEIVKEAAKNNISEQEVDDYYWHDADTCRECFNLSKPRLAFLQACSCAKPETQSLDIESLRSLAGDLARFGIPAVIAMQYEIGVEDACIFTKEVYKSISEGQSVGEAVKDGRRLLGRKAKGGKGAWADRRFATPVVFLGGPDVIVTPIEGSQAQIRCPYPDCNAFIRITDKACVDCRRKLEKCQKCGTLFASEIGFCGACGTSQAPSLDSTLQHSDKTPQHVRDNRQAILHDTSQMEKKKPQL